MPLGERFKNTYEILNLRGLKNQLHIKIVSFSLWVRYFVWNFKGSLRNSTQNISPIHWKMCILLKCRRSSKESKLVIFSNTAVQNFCLQSLSEFSLYWTTPLVLGWYSLTTLLILPLQAFLSDRWVSVRPSAKRSMSITSVQVISCDIEFLDFSDVFWIYCILFFEYFRPFGSCTFIHNNIQNITWCFEIRFMFLFALWLLLIFHVTMVIKPYICLSIIIGKWLLITFCELDVKTIVSSLSISFIGVFQISHNCQKY